MLENIIELRNLSKRYGDNQVLDNLSLDIKKNEFLTLLGPSGCGKTTTLKIIAGFEYADEGKVLFEEHDITDIPPYERQINTVFQKYALFPH
ncbi:MAG: ATP-binding cassette domain-containing protein, partial [Paeniclostridium sordellii]|nr:ATP-binding cassette domain-containing protein [Paeniclostridium sordellii]